MFHVLTRRRYVLTYHRATLAYSSSPSSYNLNPKTLFAKGKHSTAAVSAALKEHHKRITFTEIANILFVSSKNHYVLNSAQMEYIVLAVQQKKGNANAVSISKFFYGLKLQSSDDRVVLRLLREVCTLLTSNNCQFKSFNGQALGAMVYGFQRMSSDHVEVRNMLNFFREVIDSSRGHLFTPQNASGLFYGIQNMNSDYFEVRAFLRSLSTHLHTNYVSKNMPPNQTLNTHFISNMACGFKSMTDAHAEVRDLLRWLSDVTKSFTEQVINKGNLGDKNIEFPLQWTSGDISTALYGLQCMGYQSYQPFDQPQNPLHSSADYVSLARMDGGDSGKGDGLARRNFSRHRVLSVEVLSLLTHLNSSFQKSMTPFLVKHIGRSMFSLNKMPSEHAVVRNIVSTLTQKVTSQRMAEGSKSRHTIPDSILAKAIYGLHSMRSDNREVVAVVELLANILQCEGKRDMSLQASCMALYGMSNLRSSDDGVQTLLSVIAERMAAAGSNEVLLGRDASSALCALQVFRENGQETSVNDISRSSSINGLSEREYLIRQQVLKTILCRLDSPQSQHGHMDGLAVRGALKGLTLLSTDIPEVTSLLQVLLRKSKRINCVSAYGSTQGGGRAYEASDFAPDHALGAMSYFENVDSCAIVKQWLSFLSDTLLEGLQTCPPPKISYVVSAYRGLRNMSSQCEAVRKALKVLYVTINGFKHHDHHPQQQQAMTERCGVMERKYISRWESIDVALVLNSLQCMDCFHAEVRNTLQALLAKTVRERDPISAAGDIKDSCSALVFCPDRLSLSLYGLRNMTPLYSEVSDTLTLLRKGIEKHQRQQLNNPDEDRVGFTARTATTCLYGLQNMTSNHPEVKKLLKIILVAIEKCPMDDTFGHQELGSAYFGLQSMDSTHEEVIEVLKVVNDRLESRDGRLDDQTVADILFGLQRCSMEDSVEVVRAVELLHANITEYCGDSSTTSSSADSFGGINLGHASRSVYGLLCMRKATVKMESTGSSQALVTYFLTAIKHRIWMDNERGISIKEQEVLSLYRSLILIKHHVGDVMTLASVQLLNEIIGALEEPMLAVAKDVCAHESTSEKRFAAVVKRLFQFQRCDGAEVCSAEAPVIETSSVLHGFSCDLVVRSPISDLVCNIEFDGPSHLLPRKKLLCYLRDSFLQEACGVRIIRVDLCSELSDEDLAAFVKSKLSPHFSFQ